MDRPTLIPRIFLADVPGLVAFVREVFDAEGELFEGRPTELTSGRSLLMISDGGGVRAPQAAALYVYVADVDEVFTRAVARGALVVQAPMLQPWGDRVTTFEDRWGNLWQAAQPAGSSSANPRET